MENNNDSINEKKFEKFVNKAKSCNSRAPAPSRLKNEGVKRKSFYVNEAVRSLDLALGGLKKSKVVSGEHATGLQTNSTRQIFMDPSGTFSYSKNLDNTSMMSMNFSHYELMRNLSASNCNSEADLSGNTNDRNLNPTDLSVKDEHLEKYFRSVEMWSRKRKAGPSDIHFELPEQ